MAKQFSKSAQSRSYGGGNGSIAQGANLETLRYQNEAALRSPHEDDAELFNDIGNSVSNPGQRPRGLGANLAAGISKGLAYGSKTKATEEKKGKYDKYANVMNYLQEANTAAVEQTQWYEKRENAKKEMIPQVLSYIDNIDRLDPQSQRIMAQDMLAQYGEAIGEDFKLSSIDGSNPFLMTIQGSKGQQLFDLRSMFAGEQATQQAIAMKMPEYQMKLQEERTNKQREFDQKQDALDVKKYEKGIEGGRYGVKGGNSSQGEPETLDIDGTQYRVGDLSQLEKSARSHYQKKVNDSLDSIPKNNQALEAIETMREVFDRNPNIGTSFINMLDNPDGIDSGWNIIARKLAGQDLTDMEILKKATNDLNLDTILGITGKAATDLLKRAVQAASPSGKLTKGGFDKNAKTWENKARTNNRLITARYEAMLKGKSIAENPRGSANKSMGGQSSSASITQPQDEWSNIWKPVS